MTNCNDCLHEAVCDMSSRQMWSIMAGEKECSDFKDRTQYVEVVRCKDCKYWDEDRRCNGIKNGLVMEYTWDDDFCSYGERKDNV